MCKPERLNDTVPDEDTVILINKANEDGKEINRIVESPIESLEKDMIAILSGKDYKHTYAE